MDILLKILIFILFFLLCCEDLKEQAVSNNLNFFLLGLSLFTQIRGGESWERLVIYAAVYPLPFLLLYLYGSDFYQKEILGLGDIKFLLSIGLLLAGKALWQSLYYFYFISFSFAAVLGLSYLFFFQKKETPMIPAFVLGYYLVEVYL